MIYEGPNVMLGYAESRDDLALGDVREGRLETGDLGVLDAESYLTLTGRAKRFAKLHGLRIGLDEVEARFAAAGEVAAFEKGDKIPLFTTAFAAATALVPTVAAEYKIQAMKPFRCGRWRPCLVSPAARSTTRRWSRRLTGRRMDRTMWRGGAGSSRVEPSAPDWSPHPRLSAGTSPPRGEEKKRLPPPPLGEGDPGAKGVEGASAGLETACVRLEPPSPASPVPLLQRGKRKNAQLPAALGTFPTPTGRERKYDLPRI